MDKKTIESEIQGNIDFVSDFFHTFGLVSGLNTYSSKKDFARISFVLFALAKAQKANFNVACDLIHNVEEIKLKYKTQAETEKEDRQYFLLYLLRIYKILNIDYSEVLSDFSKTDFSKICTYPVLAYIYVNTYLELNLKEVDEKYEEMFMLCKKYFEYLLFINNVKNSELFFISELSAWRDFPNYMQDEAKIQMENYLSDYIKKTPTSSGVAKCLEHFGRLNDLKNFNKIIDLLEDRKPTSKTEFLNPFLLNHNCVYFEDFHSQFISLDTNAHIILAYLNLYEHAK